MSFWPARRKSLLLARAFSSAGNAVRGPAPAHSASLSPEKMRALIAMYHQTETFVTKENLEKKIDEAFTNRDAVPERVSLSLRDFQDLLRERRSVPTVTEWTPAVSTRASFQPTTSLSADGSTLNFALWSTKNQTRESKVVEALYGVETLGIGRALPGLETLDDNAVTIETSEREDRERYEDSDF